MSGIDFDFDFSEVRALAASIQKASEAASKNIVKAINISALKTKEAWAENAKGIPHAKRFPHSISYDIAGLSAFGATVIKAEIGPDKHRPQGALGNLLEFGSINNAPKNLGARALKSTEQDFVDGLEKALSDALDVAGL